MDTTGDGTHTKLSAVTCYMTGERAIAVRTTTDEAGKTKLVFLAGDNHGTSSLAIESVTLTFVKRYLTPFGVPRGDDPPADWPDDKGFLGKPTDTKTGLTHLGAREYDPATALFLSVDPAFEPEKPQTLNGYAYGNNNPATFTDPTGLSYLDTSRHAPGGGAIGGVLGGAIHGGASGGGGQKSGGGGWGTAPNGSGSSAFHRITCPSQASVHCHPSWDGARPTPGLGARLRSPPAGPHGGLSPSPRRRIAGRPRARLFFGWLWGGGYPLRKHQDFRGGDAFTAILAVDDDMNEKRVELLGKARDKGRKAVTPAGQWKVHPSRLRAEPGRRTLEERLSGSLERPAGNVEQRQAWYPHLSDAFLPYRATGRVKSVNLKEGTARLAFTAHNGSDWQSATHWISRDGTRRWRIPAREMIQDFASHDWPAEQQRRLLPMAGLTPRTVQLLTFPFQVVGCAGHLRPSSTWWRRSRVKVRTLALVVSTLILASACGASNKEVEVSARHLVGAWRGPDGERIDLMADHTFTASDLQSGPLSELKCPKGRSGGRWGFYVSNSRSSSLWEVSEKASKGSRVGLNFRGGSAAQCFIVFVVDAEAVVVPVGVLFGFDAWFTTEEMILTGLNVEANDLRCCAARRSFLGGAGEEGVWAMSHVVLLRCADSHQLSKGWRTWHGPRPDPRACRCSSGMPGRLAGTL